MRCCNLETAFFSFYDSKGRERGKDKRNYGCCHEAINWKFAEFSPSPLLFLAQYLFAHCALFSDEFNGFELRAREPKKVLANRSGLKPQRIASEGRFLPSSQQCSNCPSDMVSALPSPPFPYLHFPITFDLFHFLRNSLFARPLFHSPSRNFRFISDSSFASLFRVVYG